MIERRCILWGGGGGGGGGGGVWAFWWRFGLASRCLGRAGAGGAPGLRSRGGRVALGRSRGLAVSARRLSGPRSVCALFWLVCAGSLRLAAPCLAPPRWGVSGRRLGSGWARCWSRWRGWRFPGACGWRARGPSRGALGCLLASARGLGLVVAPVVAFRRRGGAPASLGLVSSASLALSSSPRSFSGACLGPLAASRSVGCWLRVGAASGGLVSSRSMLCPRSFFFLPARRSGQVCPYLQMQAACPAD